MNIKLGQKLYHFDEENLNQQDLGKINEAAKHIATLDTKIKLDYERNKKDNFINAAVRYILNSRIIMSIINKLNKLKYSIEKDNMDRQYNDALIAEPVDDFDQEYNGYIEDMNKGYATVINDVRQAYEKCESEADTLLKTASEKLEIPEETEKEEKEKETYTYSLDDILAEYESKVANRQFTASDKREVDDILAEYEAKKINKEYINQKSSELAQECADNTRIAARRYKETEKSLGKITIFTRIKNLFNSKNAEKKTARAVRQAKREKLNALKKDTAMAAKKAKKSAPKSEADIEIARAKVKAAVATATLVLGGIALADNIKSEKDRAAAQDISFAELNEVANLPVANLENAETVDNVENPTEVESGAFITDRGELVVLSGITLDGNKLQINIDRNRMIYEEIWETVSKDNVDITVSQIKGLVEEYLYLDGLDIPNSEKEKELVKYMKENNNLTFDENIGILRLYNQKLSEYQVENKSTDEIDLVSPGEGKEWDILVDSKKVGDKTIGLYVSPVERPATEVEDTKQDSGKSSNDLAKEYLDAFSKTINAVAKGMADSKTEEPKTEVHESNNEKTEEIDLVSPGEGKEWDILVDSKEVDGKTIGLYVSPVERPADEVKEEKQETKTEREENKTVVEEEGPTEEIDLVSPGEGKEWDVLADSKKVDDKIIGLYVSPVEEKTKYADQDENLISDDPVQEMRNGTQVEQNDIRDEVRVDWDVTEEQRIIDEMNKQEEERIQKQEKINKKITDAANMVHSIMHESNNPDKRYTLEQNLKEYGLDKAASEIYDKYSEQGPDVVESRLQEVVMSIQQREENPEIYEIAENIVRSNIPEGSVQEAVEYALSKSGKTFNIDTKELAKTIAEEKGKDSSRYEKVDNIARQIIFESQRNQNQR